MKDEDVKLFLMFPLFMAIGILFFSILASFSFGNSIMQMAICVSFGLSIAELVIVYLFQDELKRIGVW